MDDRREPFGMPFANREVAVIVANELNRHDRGIWFYTVERQIEGKRWIIVRDGRELDFGKCHCELRQAPQTTVGGAVGGAAGAIVGAPLADSFALSLANESRMPIESLEQL
jgi:hypothetical protein